MTLENIIQSIINIASNQDSIVKILLVLFLSFYILFALIVMVQIKRFTTIIDQVSFSPVIKMLSSTHLIVSVVLLIGTVIFL